MRCTFRFPEKKKKYIYIYGIYIYLALFHIIFLLLFTREKCELYDPHENCGLYNTILNNGYVIFKSNLYNDARFMIMRENGIVLSYMGILIYIIIAQLHEKLYTGESRAAAQVKVSSSFRRQMESSIPRIF